MLASTAEPARSLFSDLLPVLVVLFVVVLVGGAIIYVARRAASTSSSIEPPFTLQDLRDLHREGELSDEEFEKAKEAMIGRLKPGAAPDETGNRSEGSD